MSNLPVQMRKLDKALDGLERAANAMTLSELSGFLTGIVVCPELILPGEWLGYVWGEQEDGEPAFKDERQAGQLIDLIMQFYNGIIQELDAGDDRYQPVFDVQQESGEIVCVFWLLGFSRAMSLRPESWLDIEEGGDEDAVTALAILGTLIMLDAGEASDLPDEEVEELLSMQEGMIPHCVQKLHDWRRNHSSAPARPGPKAGRNDPCPCGSGKKYEKCCGSN